MAANYACRSHVTLILRSCKNHDALSADSQKMDMNKDNPFVGQIKDQKFMKFPELRLECGDVLHDVPVAYKTWGTLNEAKDNVIVVCHALSGSADVEDWWSPVLGSGRALNTDRFFIICINGLGSPYGTASPATINPDTGRVYGPEFPLCTIKDDVKLQRMVLDRLGVKQIAMVLGGSMGGMVALEFAFFGKEYVNTVILLATCAYHSAWAISWGEAQRQSIYADPKYREGYYPFDDPPSSGLAAARMTALLTYRSRNSFDSKFGRNIPDPLKHKASDAADDSSSDELKDRWNVHNHGNKSSKHPVSYRPKPAKNYFTAQSYLRYQGAKFVERFDANCYIATTRKLDTHDVARGRADTVEDALHTIKQSVLVIGVNSDGLFTFTEQEKLQENIRDATLIEINSPEGHDAFLLEFEQINELIVEHLEKNCPKFMKGNEQKPIGAVQESDFGASTVVSW